MRLERRSSAGRGSFDEILFNFIVAHGERTVLSNIYNTCIRFLLEEKRERSRRVAQSMGVEKEREYNRLLVAWFEFAEVQGTMCDCLK